MEPLQKCICPASPNCSWVGCNVYDHYYEKHPFLIVKHPYTILPNIKNNFESNQTFRYNGFQFLLQTKHTEVPNKLWHCVVFLGDPKLTELFQYKIEYTSKTGSVVKFKNVQKQERKFTMRNEDSIEVSLRSLFWELGEYDKMNFSLTVTMVEKQCYFCKSILSEYPVHCYSDRFNCHLCDKNVCKNIERGCTYHNTNLFEKNKHEDWYCNFAQRFCKSCQQNIEEPWFEHRSTCTKDMKEFLVDSNIMTQTDLKVDEFYFAVLKCFEITFYCKWRVGKFGNINMTITTEEDCKNFDCKLIFMTVYDSEIELNVCKNWQDFWNLSMDAADSGLEDVIVKNMYNMILKIQEK